MSTLFLKYQKSYKTRVQRHLFCPLSVRIFSLGLALGFSSFAFAGPYKDCLKNMREMGGLSEAEIGQICEEFRYAEEHPLEEAAVQAGQLSKNVSKENNPPCHQNLGSGMLLPVFTYQGISRGEWWQPIKPFLENRSFVKESIKDDGDCAFSAMDLSRAEFIRKVEKTLKSRTVSTREKQEVLSLLNASFLTEKERISERKRTGQGVDEALDREITEFTSVNEKNAPQFLKNVLSKKTYYATNSDIELASKVFGVNVLILDSPNSNSGLRLPLGSGSALLNNKSAGKSKEPSTYYLFHNGTNHFDRLLETEDPNFQSRREKQISKDESFARRIQNKQEAKRK